MQFQVKQKPLNMKSSRMAGLLVVSVVGVLTGVSLSQSEAPKHPLSLEAQSELKAAEAARLDGLYDQAAEHQLKAIRVDPSHPELLSLLPGLFKDARQPDARQPLHLLASIDALLAFSRTATRDKANAAINELKQRASIQENLLLTEAENLLKKLPNGSALYDSQIGYVNVPQEEFAATKERDEILDKQFRAKWATMEAIYDACVRVSVNMTVVIIVVTIFLGPRTPALGRHTNMAGHH